MGQQTEAIIGQLPTGGPGRNNAKLSGERLPKSGGCRSEVHAIPREYCIAVGFEVENRVAYEGFISPYLKLNQTSRGTVTTMGSSIFWTGRRI
jgi:hypothetical protein